MISSEKVLEQKSIEDEEEDEIIVDENQQDDNTDKQKTNSRTQNNNLRCRQCDYEADDLSDLLMHRKSHALIKNKIYFDRKYNSDIENDEHNQPEEIFDYGMSENNNNIFIRTVFFAF